MPDLWPLRRPTGARRLSAQSPRVAVDLLGGDAGPEVVVDGALQAAARWPELELLLVGPPDDTAGHLVCSGIAVDPEGQPIGAGSRLHVVAATQRIAMDEDPVRAVRARRDSSVRVASRLVRDGQADAAVSVGHTGAAMAGALFTLGRLPGVTRPPLAVVIPATHRRVILLDAGATVEAGPDLLLQFALAGAAYAQAHLGVPRPTIGLLSVGSEPGKGDPVRKEAAALLHDVLAGLPVEFAGNVESDAVALGGIVDVVVTDGFTGNVLLKGMEGAVAAFRAAAASEPEAVGDGGASEMLSRVARRLGPDEQGGAALLGVNGVVVVGHGASTPAAVASCIGAAAQAVREGMLPRMAAAMGGLIERRRTGQGPASWLQP